MCYDAGVAKYPVVGEDINGYLSSAFGGLGPCMDS